MDKMTIFGENNILKDLTYLEWDISKISPGTPGMFLKSYEQTDDKLYYYKMSNCDSSRGVFGHESINEIVAMNVGKILEINCLDYELVHCKVKALGRELETFVTRSENFRLSSEDKVSLETFYALNCNNDETVMDFLQNKGLDDFLSEMFLLDWIICNRDRHGANIEVLTTDQGFRMAPLFDQGLSFMFSCYDSGERMLSFNYLQDLPVNNYLGSRVLSENLNLVSDKIKERFFRTNFEDSEILRGLDHATVAVPTEYWDCIIKMIKGRVEYAKNFFNN